MYWFFRNSYFPFSVTEWNNLDKGNMINENENEAENEY